MNPLYPLVAKRAERRFDYCRAPEEVFNFPFEVEHVTPRAHDSPDTLENIALSCHCCNRFKSDFETGIDAETGQKVALFHLRRDEWQLHFCTESETALTIGLTPTGRATVLRLQMNRPQQIRERRHWMRLGVFP